MYEVLVKSEVVTHISGEKASKIEVLVKREVNGHSSEEKAPNI